MNKKQFIDQFVPQFLAAHVAKNYNAISIQGGWKNYKPPTEDAVSLAERSWEALKGTNPEMVEE
jgi:hypothetical protein